MESWMHFLTMFYAGAVGDAIAASVVSSDAKHPRIYRPLQGSSSEEIGVLGQVTSHTESHLLLLQYFLDHNNRYETKTVLPVYGRWILTKPPLLSPLTAQLLYGSFDLKTFEQRRKKLYREHPLLKDPIFKENSASFIHVPVFLLQASDTNEDQANLSCRRDASLLADTTFAKQANILYLQLLLSYFRSQPFVLNVGKYRSLKIRNILRDAREGVERKMNVSNEDWVGHNLYLALYTHYHLDDFQKGIEWVLSLGGDLLTHTFVVACVLGAKLNTKLWTSAFFTTQLHLVLGADTKLGSLKRPSSLHPSMFPSLLNQMFSQEKVFPLLQSVPNRNHLSFYRSIHLVPVLYRQTSKKSRTYNAYFILDENTLVTVKVLEEAVPQKEMYTTQYWVQSLELRKNIANFSEILLHLQYEPSKTNLLFRGKPVRSDRAFVFVHHFARALVFHSIGESDAVFDLTLIAGEDALEIFYGKKYFLVEG
jgi:hypothetical protein